MENLNLKSKYFLLCFPNSAKRNPFSFSIQLRKMVRQMEPTSFPLLTLLLNLKRSRGLATLAGR